MSYVISVATPKNSQKNISKKIRGGKRTNKTTVAVPTKYRNAFSPPALCGCSLTCFAGGSSVGRRFVAGRSRVGGWTVCGSRVRCCMFELNWIDWYTLGPGTVS